MAFKFEKSDGDTRTTKAEADLEARFATPMETNQPVNPDAGSELPFGKRPKAGKKRHRRVNRCRPRRPSNLFPGIVGAFSMMMIDTELKPSPIHGLGVFLLVPVQKGDLIWQFDAQMDRVYTEQEVESLPLHVRDYLKTYSTFHAATGLYVLCGDNGRFFNHSTEPSTVSDAISFGGDRAARDLAAGEELTSDYRTICDNVRMNGSEF